MVWRQIEKSALTCLRRQMTRTQRISRVSGQARTRRRMIYHPAFGVEAANANARVFTFIVNACFGPFAIGVQNAFGPTAYVRISVIFWQACTRPSTVSFLTYSISTTRRRVARIRRNFDWRLYCKTKMWLITPLTNGILISVPRHRQK